MPGWVEDGSAYRGLEGPVGLFGVGDDLIALGLSVLGTREGSWQLVRTPILLPGDEAFVQAEVDEGNYAR